MHQRSSFCAQEARRLDAAGQRGRAEARGRRHGRSLGTLVEESGWRLVWPEEGSSWPLRHVRASSDGSVGTGRGRAQSEEQSDASSLTDNRPAPLHRQHSIPNLSGLCYGRGTLLKNFRYEISLARIKIVAEVARGGVSGFGLCPKSSADL